jgi:hypothetical protein
MALAVSALEHPERREPKALPEALHVSEASAGCLRRSISPVLANATGLPVALAAQAEWDAEAARAYLGSAGANQAEAVGAALSAVNRNALAAQSGARGLLPSG